MSEFVDYNKRSVTLPDGCKDLTDLLERKVLPETLRGRRPFFTRNERGTLTFSGLGKHLELVYHTEAKHSTFRLQCGDVLRIMVCKYPLPGIVGLIMADDTQEMRQSMDLFFTSHGLELPPVKGDHHLPNLSYRIQPMPQDFQSCAELLKALLREVAGLDEKSALTFSHYETREKA